MIQRPTLVLSFLLVAALAVGGVVLATRDSGPTSDPLAGSAAQGGVLTAAPTIARVVVSRIPERVIEGAGSAAFEVIVEGTGFFGTAFGPFVRFDGKDATAVVLDETSPDRRILALAPPGLSGRVEVVVENPDRQSARAFTTF